MTVHFVVSLVWKRQFMLWSVWDGKELLLVHVTLQSVCGGKDSSCYVAFRGGGGGGTVDVMLQSVCGEEDS